MRSETLRHRCKVEVSVRLYAVSLMSILKLVAAAAEKLNNRSKWNQGCVRSLLCCSVIEMQDALFCYGKCYRCRCSEQVCCCAFCCCYGCHCCHYLPMPLLLLLLLVSVALQLLLSSSASVDLLQLCVQCERHRCSF